MIGLSYRSRSASAPPVAAEPPDLRLVGMALATWLSAFALLPASAPVSFAAATVAVASTGVLWRWGGDTAWVGVAVAVLIGVVCGSAATGARQLARDATAITTAAAHQATVAVALTIRRDARELSSNTGRPPSWLLPVWLDTIDSGDGPVRVRARALVLTGDSAWHSLVPGQSVLATGRLSAPRGGDLTAAVLWVSEPPLTHGDPPWIQHAAGSLREGLRHATAALPSEPGGLVPGLAVGDVRNLDPGVREDFFVTGMTHLVAVSGTHCAIVTGFVFLLARAARAPPWLVAVISAAAIVGYVVLCQASPSVLRAGVMGLIALVALASGRLRAAVPALAVTVTVLVVADPELAGAPGFALSVMATSGLLFLAPRWRDGLRRRGVPPGLAEALAVPAAAQLAVSPMLAGMTGTISLVAVAANLVATPVMVPATLLGVLAAVASPVWLAAAEFLAWLASWPAWWMVLVARYGAQAPAAIVPWPDGWAGGLLLAGLAIALLVAARLPWVRRLAAVVAAATVIGALPVHVVAGGWPPPGAVLITCAVGQGDLMVLPLRPGEAIVIDTGPDPTEADRCLRDLGVRSVPLLVISHYHVDHVGGVAGVLRHRDVAAVLTTALPEPEFGYTLFTDAVTAAGVPVHPAQPDATYQVGQVSLRVLGPPYPLRGTRSDANNNSLVLMAQVRGVRVLLAGDAEHELQQELLARLGPRRLRADVLKVAHHGSVYQEKAFIDAVAPAVAVVPVGAENSHGHPHPTLLSWLEQTGARVLRTDTDGDVAVVHRDGEFAVATRQPSPTSAGRRPTSGAAPATSRLPGIATGHCGPRVRRWQACPTASCWCSVTRSCWWPGRWRRRSPRCAPLTPTPKCATTSPAT